MDCLGAFMLVHVTLSASPYLENLWLWVADHEFDRYNRDDDPDNVQLTVYNGRGMLVESTKGAWLWGTASEHSVLSNYQLHNADNVLMAFIQSETAYFQSRLLDARQPFRPNAAYADPDFSACGGGGGGGAGGAVRAHPRACASPTRRGSWSTAAGCTASSTTTTRRAPTPTTASST